MEEEVMKKKIEAWAVINIEQNDICIFNDDRLNTFGAALFTSDWDGLAYKEATDWVKENNLKGIRRVKVLPVTITYTLPSSKVPNSKRVKKQ